MGNSPVSLSCFDSGAWRLSAKEGKKALVFVHGLAACCLQTKVSPSVDIGCSLPCSDALGWDNTWLALEEVVTGIERFRNALLLETVEMAGPDGSRVLSTRDLNGVKVRPFRGLDGIAVLNPGEPVKVIVYEHLIRALAPRYRLSAMNWDWRRWGDAVFMEERVEEFRTHVERESAALGGGPVVAVHAHSLGTTVVAYCLSVLGDDWVRKFVSQVMLSGTAIPGSPKQCSSFAHNPTATLLGLQVPGLVEDFFRECMVRAPSMASLLPTQAVGAEVFPPEEAIVVAPSRSYTAGQMQEFVSELERRLPEARVPTAKFWPQIERSRARIKAPPVPTHLLYGWSVDTPVQLRFACDDLAESPEVARVAPGDGTISAASVEALAAEWRRQGRGEVTLHRAPDDVEEQEHMAFLRSGWLAEQLTKLLG